MSAHVKRARHAVPLPVTGGWHAQASAASLGVVFDACRRLQSATQALRSHTEVCGTRHDEPTYVKDVGYRMWGRLSSLPSFTHCWVLQTSVSSQPIHLPDLSVNHGSRQMHCRATCFPSMDLCMRKRYDENATHTMRRYCSVARRATPPPNPNRERPRFPTSRRCWNRAFQGRMTRTCR